MKQLLLSPKNAVEIIEQELKEANNGLLEAAKDGSLKLSKQLAKLDSFFSSNKIKNTAFYQIDTPDAFFQKELPPLLDEYLRLMLNAGEGLLSPLYPYLLSAYIINYSGNTILKGVPITHEDTIEKGLNLLFYNEQIPSELKAARQRLAKSTAKLFSLEGYYTKKRLKIERSSELQVLEKLRNKSKQSVGGALGKGRLNSSTILDMLYHLYVFFSIICICYEAEIIETRSNLVYNISCFQQDTGLLDFLPRIRIVHCVLNKNQLGTSNAEVEDIYTRAAYYGIVVNIRNFLNGDKSLKVHEIISACETMRDIIQNHFGEISNYKTLKDIPEVEVAAACLHQDYELTYIGEQLLKSVRDKSISEQQYVEYDTIFNKRQYYRLTEKTMMTDDT